MWLSRSEDGTNPEYGKSPENRTIDELLKSSLIVVDKHSGPTSHQVSAWVKDIFGAKIAGHSGTLDPAVTGVLPVVLGDATKAMPVLSGLDKEYVGVMHLHKEVPEDVLRNVIIGKFIGKIRQRPPVKSAVARVEREREIYYFDIVEIGGRDVLFKVGCEAGTYIRKLCHDIGKALDTGAHMSELRRTRVGKFTEDKSFSLVQIRDAYETWKEDKDEKMLRKILMPIEFSIPHVKKIMVKDSAVDALCNGSPLYPKGISQIEKDIIKGETVAIMTLKGEMIALGISKMESDEMIKRKIGTAVRVDRVLMQRGIYPSWKEG